VRPTGPSLALALSLALAPAPAGALGLQIGLSYSGATLASSGFIPPDTMGAVGPAHVVQFVNGEVRVHRKSDGALLQQWGSAGFWEEAGVSPSDNFDPRIVYDAGSGRWFAVEVDRRDQPNDFLLAVSHGADPTGGWSAFRIASDPSGVAWADFPSLGVNADTVVLTATNLRIGGGGGIGGGLDSTVVVVVPKADLVGPAPTAANATRFARLGLAQLQFHPQPSVDLDGGGLTTYLIGGGTVPSAIQVARIEGTPAEPELEGLGADGLLLVESYGGPPPAAEQPGPAANLETSLATGFSANAVIQNGALWAVRALNVDGRAAVQWLQIDPDTRILLQEGVIADPELDLFYPSIAVNELDEVVIGMSGSSESVFPSVYAIAGETVAGVTGFGELELLQAGLASYEIVANGRNRWGDYSATVVDPSDPRVFWTFQEWADEGGASWATQITQLFVPEPGASLLALAAVLAGVGTVCASSHRASGDRPEAA